MKNNSELKDSLKCYLVISLLSIIFFTTIIFSAELTNHSVLSMLPKFSWEMINTFDEIFK
ncbi:MULTISPECIES: hypothetical protein [Bacillus]|uniref:hypothetical protein n=1 Tax=Bacillus TaxID=1386 RepID=UPI000BB70686|nr:MULTISPECIES: hypothetical protein [Bacillus]